MGIRVLLAGIVLVAFFYFIIFFNIVPVAAELIPSQLANSICQAVIGLVQLNERQQTEIEQLKKQLAEKEHK